MSSSQFNPLLWQNVNLDDPSQIREFMRQLIPYLAWLQQRLIVLLNAPPPTGGGGTGDMTKAVYDTNNNGICDSCDALPYGRLTGVPTTFTPTAHAPTHLDNGSDPIPVVTTTRTGLVPKLNGTATTYLNGTGAYSTPPVGGSGDMLKSVYDTDANNVVDTCDSLAYSKLTGVPSSFTPAAHASTHLSAGSDPIAIATSVLAGLCPAVDNTTIQIVASKLSCVALAWTAITGKPTTFTPSAHASTHLSSGSDPIAAATATASGLVPTPPNNTTTFLRGDATFATVPGGGDMLKSTYDTNANGKVDTCDSLPYASLTGVPSTFAPSAHASSHRDTGSDPIGYYEWTYTGGAS